MKLVLDAFGRALGYMFLPRVIWLSLLPLVLCAGTSALLGYLFWEDAVAGVRQALDHWGALQTLLGWLDGVGAAGLRAVMAPLIVVSLAVPVVVVVSLLLVAAWMAPSIAKLVRERRFPSLPSRADEPWLMSLLRSLVLSAAALAALIVSLPLWLVPPLAAFIPPLIWGWLTAQVMSADVLTEHASRAERGRILREHRWPLLMMGLVCGYMGAAPSMIWAFGAASIFLAPLLIPVAVWLYMLVFVFAALWYAHYCLAALHALRQPPASAFLRSSITAPAPLDGPDADRIDS